MYLGTPEWQCLLDQWGWRPDAKRAARDDWGWVAVPSMRADRIKRTSADIAWATLNHQRARRGCTTCHV